LEGHSVQKSSVLWGGKERRRSSPGGLFSSMWGGGGALGWGLETKKGVEALSISPTMVDYGGDK